MLVFRARLAAATTFFCSRMPRMPASSSCCLQTNHSAWQSLLVWLLVVQDFLRPQLLRWRNVASVHV